MLPRLHLRFVCLWLVGVLSAQAGEPAAAPAAAPAEWPCFMGPARTGVAPGGPKLLNTWPKEGPKLVWKSGVLPFAPLAGIGSPVVSGGKVYTYAHIPKPMDGIKPFNAEFLASWGWVEGMPVELSKKVDAAGGHNKELGACKGKEAVEAYANKFIATLAPEEAAKYGDAIRTRIRLGTRSFGTGQLMWMASMKDREIKSNKEFMNLFVDRSRHENHGGQSGLLAYADKVYKDQQWTDAVYCLDAATGRELWMKALPGAKKEYGVEFGCSGTPAVAQGRVFVRGSAGLYCLDAAKNGELLWEVKGPPGCGSPVVFSGVVYVLLRELLALEAKTGKELWRQPKISGENATPIIWSVAGNHFVVCNSEKASSVCCLNPDNGSIRWEVKPPGRVTYATPAIDGNTQVARGDFGGSCTAYSITPEKAEQLWTVRNMGDHAGASPVVYDGHVYLSGQWYSTDHLVNVFDLKTGALKLNQKGKVGGTTPVVADGKVFAYCDGNYKTCKLFAYKATPEKYEPVVTLPGVVLASCSSPAVADGRLYVRLPEAIACYDLTATGK